MNFIDISSYQAGIDLEKVFSLNPLDGVIVKSTEGQGYVNPYCDKWVQWLIKNNKPWGFYHFLNSHDPVAEAKYFVKNCINYFGDGLPCADYEGSIVTSYGTYYLRRFLETVFSETGIKPLVYCNLSTIQGDVNGFRSIAEEGYKLWLAQYANMNEQVGFNPNPWQRGSFAPFEKITMHQYSSMGLLEGYGYVKYEVYKDADGYVEDPSKYRRITGNYLDLDMFYGTIDDWNRLVGKGDAPEPTPADDWLTDWIEYLEDEKQRIQNKIDELKARR